MNKSKEFILWFNQVGIEDVPLVGGKNASLGEMYRNLTKKGVKIPNGFAVTSEAYRYFIDKADIKKHIMQILKGLKKSDVKKLQEVGRKIRELILNAEFPEDLKKEIIISYKRLCKQYGEHTDVAVRSSATAEDLPDASFAGQQETYLNVRGDVLLLDSCKKCFASLFTNRAIHYRMDKGFDHFKVALSIGVQKMVRSDLAASGVMFSIDTETGFQDVVLINAIYGLGENIVQGRVNPDEYYVFKPTLKLGYQPVLSKSIGNKNLRMIYATEGSKETVKNIPVPEEERKKFVLTNEEVLILAKWACIIEDHYKKS
ncbi:MAG: PEP/pyruvate-binding domain-containing protein, partial [Nanoarchaeota archaeon]